MRAVPRRCSKRHIAAPSHHPRSSEPYLLPIPCFSSGPVTASPCRIPRAEPAAGAACRPQKSCQTTAAVLPSPTQKRATTDERAVASHGRRLPFRRAAGPRAAASRPRRRQGHRFIGRLHQGRPTGRRDEGGKRDVRPRGDAGDRPPPLLHWRRYLVPANSVSTKDMGF